MQYKLNNGDQFTACEGLKVGDIVRIPITVRPNWFMRLLGKKERSVFREFTIIAEATNDAST